MNALAAVPKYKRNYTPLDIASWSNTTVRRQDKGNKKETADLLRKHGGKTAEELKAEGK